ncbi:MAG TPA: flagellar biosynthetic protein FliR [Candidatus Binatia bacterium]|nr:flagellar biosynthetic protein FliR [Candidatus Binatia bacterium]
MPIPDPTTFLLVLARIAGLVLAAPVFGHLLVPVRVRIGLAMTFAVALAPAVAPGTPDFASSWMLARALAVESATGVLLGLVAQLVFAGVQLGGQLAGIQMGFGVVNLIDPQTHAQVTVVSEWQNLLALLVFLALDVHHLLVSALLESFRTVPPGAIAISAGGIEGAIRLAGDVFVLGVRIAAPIMIALLLSNATLGLLARTVPQLNVFVVGFSLNVGVGLVMLGVSLPFTYRLLAGRFGDLAPTLGGLMQGLAHG